MMRAIDLITQVLDVVDHARLRHGSPIQQELAGRDLLPGQQLFDAGYVDAELLVTAQSQHQMEVVGPLSANSG